MHRPINVGNLQKLHEFERRLKTAASHGQISIAEGVLKDICRLFADQNAHPRLLEAKLWYFEALLDNNHPALAESGFVGICQKAKQNTRLHLEASFLKGVCLLRQKKIEQAKRIFRAVLLDLRKVKSIKSRQLLEKRIIERIEEEAILTQLVETHEGALIADTVHDQAVALIQTKSEDEILELIGTLLPGAAVQLMLDLRRDAILQLPSSDIQCLPSSTEAVKPLNLGRRAWTVLKRIGWKTLCDPESPIFKMWSTKLPEIFTASFFAKALCDAFTHWRIEIPAIVAGVVAIAMKYSAQEFCARTKPDSIMEVRRKTIG